MHIIVRKISFETNRACILIKDEMQGSASKGVGQK